MNGWDDPATARAYQEFETRHTRYALANRALARHAELRPGLAVLDLAAGCGGTVAAILPALGATGRMDAVEPAHAMAALGRRRFAADARVRWLDALDAAGSGYARITCGAAIWQWPNLDQLFAQLAARLAPGGALVFNIPAAYLGRA
ncbi:MAG: class I SAM-dependent methyltransferase, partial [Rhodocyclaceae bacterium]|nr:class I SAM-dependent methyltransferase [Rhodocyclaceae bacterium]